MGSVGGGRINENRQIINDITYTFIMLHMNDEFGDYVFNV